MACGFSCCMNIFFAGKTFLIIVQRISSFFLWFGSILGKFSICSCLMQHRIQIRSQGQAKKYIKNVILLLFCWGIKCPFIHHMVCFIESRNIFDMRSRKLKTVKTVVHGNNALCIATHLFLNTCINYLYGPYMGGAGKKLGKKSREPIALRCQAQKSASPSAIPPRLSSQC